MIGKIYNQKINSDVSNLTNLALYSLLLSHNLFFFLCSNSLWTEIYFLAKYRKNWNHANLSNRPRFSEPYGLTTIRPVSCIFHIERILVLKEPE